MNLQNLVLEVVGTKSGTAFLVSENCALTAWHTIEQDIVSGQKIELYIHKDGDRYHKIDVSVIDKDEKLDVAILSLNNVNIREIINEELCLLNISNALPRVKSDKWQAVGYPQKTHMDSRKQRLIEGTVYETLPNAVIYKYDIELECQLVNYELNIGFSGLSGAPLIIDNCIQGMVVKEEYSNLKLPFKAISMFAITELLTRNAINFLPWSPKIIVLNNYWKSEELETKNLFLSNTDNEYYMESPITDKWTKFINTKLWNEEHDKFLYFLEIQLLNAGINDFSNRITKVRALLAVQNYKLVINDYCQLIKDIIRRLEKYSDENKTIISIKDSCIDTYNSLLAPNFSKCFLIIGDSGSGKTWFTTMIAGNKQYNVINLKKYITKDKTDLRKVILEEIFEMTGKKYDTLDSFIGEWRNGNYNNKIFIIIDDLHNWQYSNPQFIYDLVDLIQATTKHHLLHWVITIQYNYYEMVSKREFINIWKTYSMEFEKDTYHLSSWFKIDDFNNETEFGIKMIKNYLEKTNNLLQLKNFEILNSYTRNQLSTPFIANIVLKLLCEGKLLSKIVNLRYVEFIEEYEESRINSLTRGLPDIYDSNQIKRAINLIYEQLITSSRMKIPYENGEEALSSSIKAHQTVENMLHLLISAGMVLKEIEKPKLSGFPDRVYLKVKEEAFGEYRATLTLLQNFYATPTMREFVTSCTRLSEINDMFKPEMPDFTSGMNEYFLLLLDKITSEVSNNQDYYMYFIEFQEKFIASAWIAGTKTNIQTQDIIFKLSQQIANDIKDKYLFEYMYFLLESHEKVIKDVECLKFLQERFAAIIARNLTGYYIYIVIRLIRQINDPNILVDYMTYINGCEILGSVSDDDEDIAKMLANISVDHLWKLCGNSLPKIMELFECFLNKIGAYSIQNQKQKGDKWFCSHYYEWVISRQCWHIICEFKTDGIKMFNAYGWFKISKNQTEKRKKHEATKAISQYYVDLPKSAKIVKTYIVQYIMELCNSKETNDLLNAYYLIFCTVPSNLIYIHGGFVAKEFIPALEKLCEVAFLGKKTLRGDILRTKTEYPGLYKNTIGPIWNKVKSRMANVRGDTNDDQ